MSLSTLPPELLHIIIGQLDMKSVYNLYEAGVVRMQGLVTKCQFSLNTLATAKSLRTDFFTAVSGHLKVLNLSGVSDLDLTSLTDALANLNYLTDLDVSYTNIIMPGFLEIVKARPSLNSICMNFLFDEDVEITMNKDLLLEYQQSFRRFKNVNLVCNPGEVFRGKLAVSMLQKADLFSLKFILHHRIELSYEYYRNINFANTKMVKLSQFQIYLNGILSSIREMPMFLLMNFFKYEVVIFVLCKDEPFIRNIYATALLKKFISEKFNRVVDDLSETVPRCLIDDFDSMAGESVFMSWDTERTKFDDEFYSNLFNTVKEYEVCYFDNSHDEQLSGKYKWYYVDHYVDGTEQDVELDYAVQLKEKEEVHLNIVAITENSVPHDVKFKLEVSNREFLSKLYHLSIDTDMNFNSNFFKNLFQLSESLVTLVLFMEEDYVDPIFFQFIKESKSIKNIYLRGFRTEFPELFRYLSECRTLENIYLIFEQTTNMLPDPRELFTKCDNLCNINIHVNMPFLPYVEMLGLYKKVRFDLRKHSLNIHINDGNNYIFSPYINVFNLYRFRPL